MTEYNKWLAQVHYRKGSLLEHDSVWLGEGPWPEKAYWDALERARERDTSYYMDYGWTRPRVVSQGPINQQTGSAQEVLNGTQPEAAEEPAETVPAPEPVPAEPIPAEPTPDDVTPAPPGPITVLPEGPSLNALTRRASARRPTAPVADRAPQETFDWGVAAGFNVAPNPLPSAVQPAVFQRDSSTSLSAQPVCILRHGHGTGYPQRPL